MSTTFFELHSAQRLSFWPPHNGPGCDFFWTPRRLKTLRRSVSQRRHVEKNAIAKKNWTHFIFDKFFPTLFCIYHWYILLELVFFGNHSQIPLELPPCGENTGGGQIPPIFRVRVSSFRVSSKIRSWNSYCQHRKLMDRARAKRARGPFPSGDHFKKKGWQKEILTQFYEFFALDLNASSLRCLPKHTRGMHSFQLFSGIVENSRSTVARQENTPTLGFEKVERALIAREARAPFPAPPDRKKS